MGTDLTFVAGSSAPELPCKSCGSGCRPIDRYCSQCGVFNPTGSLDADNASNEMLNAPTIITSDLPIPERSATFVSPDDGTMVAPRTRNVPPPEGARGRSRKRSEDEAVKALEAMLVPGGVFARRYRIQRLLGAGAMGHVASAIDDSIDEVVALKILSVPVHEDPEAFERFKMELKLARRIRHRNVVQSFDLGFADGYPYISMEYIDADNLSKHLQRKEKFDERSALAIFRQVLRGLRAAHALGIIHRDIKPENVLLNKDGVAFITDFGIATTADRVRRREIAGTPDYMAPEQLRGEDVLPASDLYACGVMLYRMVAGALPFRASTLAGVIGARLHDDPHPLTDSDVSVEMQELIESLLRRDVKARPQTVDEVLERVDVIVRLQHAKTTGSKRVTVLVADGDEQSRSFLQNVLEADGYKVLPTSNARDAVNAAFEQQPAVIFLDAGIRGGFESANDAAASPETADGLGFLRIVRGDAQLRSVPVVVMSEHAQQEMQESFTRAGAVEFLLKPFAASDVAGTMLRTIAS